MNKVLKLSTIVCLALILLMQNGFAQMVYNQAANFNGTNSYIAIPNDTELNPSTAITIETWVNPSTLASSSNIISIVGKNYQSSYSLGLFPSSAPTLAGRPLFYPKGGVVFVIGKTPIPINQWTHIAVTYDGVTTKFYFNGVLDTSTTYISGAIAANTDSLYIGCDRFAGAPDYFFNGKLDNVRLWNIARTQSDIQRDMYIPLTMHLPSGLYTGLLASYPLDGFVQDWSGSVMNNGVGRNVTYSDYSQKISTYCDYNNTIMFDGTTAYLAGGNNEFYNATTAVTLEAWIKRDTTGTQPNAGNIVNKSGSTTRYNYALFTSPGSNNVYFAINDGTYNAISPVSSVSLARWYHLAGTYEQATGLMKLYINGDSVAGFVVPGNLAINNNPDSLCIGGISASSYAVNKFKGQIDGVRIWKNVARTREQILADMYRSRMLDGSNGSTEFTFDYISNIGYTPNNAWLYGAPLMFNGAARITSEHRNLNAELTSPMLAGNEVNFYSTTDNAVSTKRYFIPDNSVTGITDSVYFNAGGTITDLTAFVLVNHTWLSDVRLTLTGPTGVSVMLTPSTGNNSGNDIMTIFTSSADSTYGYTNTGIVPFSPKIKPANPLTPFIGTTRSGWWKMKFVDVSAGDIGYVNGWGIKLMSVTGTGNETNSPYKFELAQNYPNPFNPTTKINYTIQKLGLVTLKVYDIMGREVQTLVNEKLQPGTYETSFEGSQLTSGVYFYKLSTEGFSETKKMLMIK